VATNFLTASCDKATFGWPCDAELERLREAFAKATDTGKQRALAEAVSERAAQSPTHVVLGQYLQPTAFRNTIEGLLVATNPVFWNVEKK
jgi:peptide/nickel transport system substrate-binding protein